MMSRARGDGLVRVAAIQMSMQDDQKKNLEKAIELVERAAREGARLILLPELFAGTYFPQTEQEEFFSWAEAVDNHSFLPIFQKLARQLEVVLPISFFERAGPSYYNSLQMIDADGSSLGVYRKLHVPDGPGYEEKFYFSPGNFPARVFQTRVGRIGCGICWDQWFPEFARLLALQGAEILLYPTAIGSEPPSANSLDTRKMWRRAMVGHAVSNALPVLAANRYGKEGGAEFYGNSFICDEQGEVVVKCDEPEEAVLHAEFDFGAQALFRASMGFFRDRRPDVYQGLLQREDTAEG